MSLTLPDRLAAGAPGWRIDADVVIVGSGIAGLTCAHVLGPHHDVVLYEAAARLGGHANTQDVPHGAGTAPIDTGFIVHNRRTYPHLLRIFAELGVETRAEAIVLWLRR